MLYLGTKEFQRLQPVYIVGYFHTKQKTEMTVQFICGHFKDGKDAINSRLKELIKAGFLVRKEIRNGGKFAGYNYHLSDKPKKAKVTVTGKTVTGKTVAVFTAAVNPQQSNTNNTNYITKEILKKEIPTKSKTPIFNETILKGVSAFCSIISNTI